MAMSGATSVLTLGAHTLRSSSMNPVVEYAVRACEVTSYRNPLWLDTLAAALAEAGRFKAAVVNQHRAIFLAGYTGHEVEVPAMRRQLDLYRNGMPYREHPDPAGQ